MLGWRESHGSWVPPVDVYENHDSWDVVMELPGVDLAELDITVAGDLLRVGGRKTLPEAGAIALRLEIPTGSFVRELRFDGGVKIEAVTASISLGVLSIRLPKSSPARVRIPVDPPAGGSAERS